MRYASVCDGIGAVHCAWKPLGWECAWTSEIDKFPIAVVEKRWGLPNLGDMTEITQEMIDGHGRIELLVGGTPCQSFSVAGLRGGLDDDRGNLALRFMQLCAEARPRWVVWENVPGVFSVDGGRAFGSILGAMEELGYGWAYRTLDAQWFGVAQRRRRVFVVGHLGDWRRAAAVLFEQQSVCGDPPTREAAGQGAAADAGRGAQVASHDPACCLTAREHKGALPEADLSTVVAFKPSHYTRGKDGSPKTVTPPLSADADKGDQDTVICHTSDGVIADPITTAEGKTWENAGNNGRLRNCVQQPYAKSKRAQSASDDETWKPGEVSPTLNHFDVGDTRATTVVAFTQNQREEVRDLGEVSATVKSPGTHEATYIAEAFSIREDAKAKNFPATPTDVGLAVQAHQPSVQSHHAQIFVAQNTFPIDTQNMTEGHRSGGKGHGEANDPSFTLTKGHSHAVAQPMAVRRLTPRECERLQGFPDDYTRIPWRRKTAEDCPDGPRYRALGNSMAVPVMRWIGERIQAVEKIPCPT